VAEVTVPILFGATCEEVVTAIPCKQCQQLIYLRCEAPAKVVVWHEKDRRAYYMCEVCGSHNIHNRGGVDVTRV
jgi:deoxycytidylate deaminase